MSETTPAPREDAAEAESGEQEEGGASGDPSLPNYIHDYANYEPFVKVQLCHCAA